MLRLALYRWRRVEKISHAEGCVKLALAYFDSAAHNPNGQECRRSRNTRDQRNASAAPDTPRRPGWSQSCPRKRKSVIVWSAISCPMSQPVPVHHADVVWAVAHVLLISVWKRGGTTRTLGQQALN